jgi:PKHD-type hydroxylase
MFLKNSYWYFSECFDKDICKKIISLGETKLARNKINECVTPAATKGNEHKNAPGKTAPKNDMTNKFIRENNIDSESLYVRDSEICWFNDQWMYDLIMPKVAEANKLAGWNWDFTAVEDIQFTKYNNSGFYGWHMDGGSDTNYVYKRYLHGITKPDLEADGEIPQGFTQHDHYIGKVRKLSVTINLTDPSDYDGGNLKFDYGRHGDVEEGECIESRKQGTMIVFPSFQQHCVTPVTRGTRYSLVLWVLGEPWR